MKLVIDVNVVISALIADSKTRELIVTLEPDLLTTIRRFRDCLYWWL
jgi:predicted nucleic acid-binding protein